MVTVTLVQQLHAALVLPGRFSHLIDAVDKSLPAETRSVLDVGAGSGAISQGLQKRHPAWDFRGVDVLVRPTTQIPVQAFDGKHLPFNNHSIDVVLLIDVLHHHESPAELLSECLRVARSRVIIKDHSQKGGIDRLILRGMDWVGNASYGVACHGHYLSDHDWTQLYSALPCRVVSRDSIQIYPFLLSLLMPRRLGILHVLSPSSSQDASA